MQGLLRWFLIFPLLSVNTSLGQDQTIVKPEQLSALRTLRLSDMGMNKYQVDEKGDVVAISYFNGGKPFPSKLSNEEISAVKNLPELKSVNLQTCYEITDEGLHHLAELGKLKSLNLSGTKINGKCLAHLRKIQTLITGKGLEELGKLTQLRSLDLTETTIVDSDLKHLNQLTNLMEFSTFDTKISARARLELFRDLQQRERLDTLILEGARIKKDDAGHVTSINFSGTGNRPKISDEHLALVSDFEHLTEITIRFHDVTTQGIKHLGGIASLKKLNLYHCPKVDDKSLYYLKNLIALEFLSLHGTGVSDAGLKYVPHFENLKSLYLFTTKVTNDGINWLKQKMPDCRIRT